MTVVSRLCGKMEPQDASLETCIESLSTLLDHDDTFVSFIYSILRSLGWGYCLSQSYWILKTNQLCSLFADKSLPAHSRDRTLQLKSEFCQNRHHQRKKKGRRKKANHPFFVFLFSMNTHNYLLTQFCTFILIIRSACFRQSRLDLACARPTYFLSVMIFVRVWVSWLLGVSDDCQRLLTMILKCDDDEKL